MVLKITQFPSEESLRSQIHHHQRMNIFNVPSAMVPNTNVGAIKWYSCNKRFNWIHNLKEICLHGKSLLFAHWRWWWTNRSQWEEREWWQIHRPWSGHTPAQLCSDLSTFSPSTEYLPFLCYLTIFENICYLQWFCFSEAFACIEKLPVWEK